MSSAELPADPRHLVAKLSELATTSSLQQGYVRIQSSDDERFLFVHKGRSFSAGTLVDDHFMPASILDFFQGALRATRAEYFATDLPLFLCTTVLFRRQPVAQIPSDIIDSETLIKHIRSTGKDAVLVIRRAEARSLVFCRSGEPAALYAAPDEEFPEGPQLAERIVKYVFKDMTYRGTSLDLYDEIRLPPGDDAGKTFAQYLEDALEVSQPAAPAAAPAAPEPPKVPNLLFWLGDRVVERVSVHGALSVGREQDNDIVLNNLSVSRNHARITQDGEKIIVEDLGSQNGIVFKGNKTQRAELSPGDEMQLGKYKVVYARHLSGEVESSAAPARSRPSGPAVEQTMALMSGEAVPVVEHNGEKHKVKGLVFTIGKDSNAHIRIGGLFVASIHARIFREPNGNYRVEHVAGRRALRVNGRPVKQTVLSNGDELLIGSHEFRFTVPQEGGAPEKASDIAALGPGKS